MKEEIEVPVIGFPKFMTPNADNKNDTWNVVGLTANNQKATTISIFDRYGKRGLDNNGDLGGGGSSAYQDFFRNAFSRRSSGTTNYTMRYQLQVTLEDLYNGITQDVVVTSPTNHQQITDTSLTHH